MKPMRAKARIMTQVDGSGTAEENSKFTPTKRLRLSPIAVFGNASADSPQQFKVPTRQADGDCGIYAQVVYAYARYTAVPNPPIATSGYQRVKYIAGPSNQLRRSDADKPK
jgi:hypothetical protein